jgi:transcriptional regulator GlxA family with amidase domain
VSRLRVERAKQLLARTTFSVESIAQLCGFASGPYFHRVFKRASGGTPRSYRRHVAVKNLARRDRPDTARSHPAG